jgi:hypothetical protein
MRPIVSNSCLHRLSWKVRPLLGARPLTLTENSIVAHRERIIANAEFGRFPITM